VLFVVTGPSGCGKSSIIHHVMRDLRNIRFSISHTTRPRRPSELDGRDYHFIGRTEFERMAAKKQFVEWALVHGHCYGTSKAEIGEKGAIGDLILDIDVQGAGQIKSGPLRAIFVFILPPKYEELRRRLRERGEDKPEIIARRLRNARREIRHYADFDYVVVNNKLDRAVLELESVILGSRCRTDVRKAEILEILKSFK